MLKVYVDLMSQPCRALVLFLRSNSIPHQQCLVDLRKGEHFTEEYEKINPFRRVPAIDHDGFILTETVAIFRYLASQFTCQPNWYPSDLQARARVDEYMAWQHMNLRLFGSMVFQFRVIIPKMKGKPYDPAKVEEWRDKLNNCLSSMEEVFFRDSSKPFVNGAADITVADLLAVCELEQPMAAGYDILAEHPKLQAYHSRVQARIGKDLYEEVHAIARRVRLGVQAGRL